MNKRNRPANRIIALGGILAALSVIAVFLASILPTGRISLFVLSSFIVSVMIMEFGLKAGIALYLATSVIAFILVPAKTDILPYVLFFGCYGIIKLLIERLRNIWLEYVLKILFFAIAAVILYFAATAFIGDLVIKLPLAGLLILAGVSFVVYDYVYTLFIAYYDNKLSRLLKIRQ